MQIMVEAASESCFQRLVKEESPVQRNLMTYFCLGFGMVPGLVGPAMFVVCWDFGQLRKQDPYPSKLCVSEVLIPAVLIRTNDFVPRSV